MKHRPRTVRIARWSATHPWRAIGIWVVFVALCVVVGGAAGTKQATDEQLGTGESGRAAEMLHDAKLDPATENVVIASRSGDLDRDQANAAAAEATQQMRALPEVESVGKPVVAENGNAMLVPITMAGDPNDAADHVDALTDVTADVQREHPDLRVEQVGEASIDKGIDDQVSQDISKAESISMPITLLIMLVAFGAIVAAGVPVLLAISAVGAGTGLYSLVSYFVPDSGSTSSVILLLGMAVGVDYSLFYLKREREERRRGKNRLDAIEIAAETSGHSVVVSALAVMVSMAGLYVAGDLIFAGLATGGIIVVAVAMLGSLTVLPALLVKFGRAVDRPRVPLVWRISNRSGEPRLWPALLRPALRRPGLTLTISVLLMAALALPAFTMKLRNSNADTLPRSISVLQTYDRMTADFPNEGTQHDVVVRAAADQADDVTAALEQLDEKVTADSLFVSQPAQVQSSDDGTVHSITVVTPYGPTNDKAEQSLDKLRDDYVPDTVGAIDGAEYAVGGEVADNLDYSKHITDKLPWVIGFVLVLTFVMMVVTFRSVVVALTAITINLLSALASFGLLVGVFQHTWAEGILDYKSTGTIIAWIPLFLFVVLFGLSMDYHVFVVSRIREGVVNGLSTRDAVAQGITRSAGVVTSAALVMVSVFAAFAVLEMADMKQMGFGLAAAVLLDAVIIRALVLPSIMTLLGRANWWPGKLSRRRSGQPVAPEARELQVTR